MTLLLTEVFVFALNLQFAITEKAEIRIEKAKACIGAEVILLLSCRFINKLIKNSQLLKINNSIQIT